ncbi:MAG TPA: FAD-binding protein, partial [Acidimicrobiia bacterium]|nr:FAD-binding protein [Acidimicrobiia bacterium]
MTTVSPLLGVDALAATVGAASSVLAVGARTQWEVGGLARADAALVEAPSGIVHHDPRDLTVTVGAGTPVGVLAAALREHGQECPLDPRHTEATVGGVLACGLSGHRRLRYGPLRDRVLEVRFVTADGRVVKGGGPTVKNVTGFDIPRLLVGSLGTLGVLVQVTLRCQPLPPEAQWSTTALDPFAVRRAAFRPSCIAWDGTSTHVLFEGVTRDIAAERTSIAGEPSATPPAFPEGPHRGRVSIRPGLLSTLGAALDACNVRWLAEVGVGTVHVAADEPADLAAARVAAEAAGGWMLREAGAPELDGFGVTTPNQALMARIRDAFDPTHKLGVGRMDPLLSRREPHLEGS